MGADFHNFSARSVLQKFPDRNAERNRQPRKHDNGWIADAPFDTADIGPVQTTFMRQTLLGEEGCQAVFLQIEAHTPAYIHGPFRPQLLLFRLQPISLFLLDLLAAGSKLSVRGDYRQWQA